MATVVWDIQGFQTVADDSEHRVACADTTGLDVTNAILVQGAMTFGDVDADAATIDWRYRVGGVNGSQIGRTFSMNADALAANGGIIAIPPVALSPGRATETSIALTVQFVGASGPSEVRYATIVLTYGDMPQTFN